MAQQIQGQFGYKTVQLIKAKRLGTGAYGAVYKAMLDDLPCAGKILHPTLFESNDPGTTTVMERFRQECSFLSTLRHPKIVQYLDLYQDPETLVLLMELMDESLTKFLERSQEQIPYHTQVNICHDVVLALAYLHSNDIIHRDLSSNNVLLIGNRAKVTDFGMAKIFMNHATTNSLTTCPGTVAYMPPEAFDDPPVYNMKLDSFSFGVLDIQIITRLFPSPSHRTRKFKDPQNPNRWLQEMIPETERRKSHIDLIDITHPLLPIANECLSYNEEDRPSAQQLCQRLAALKEASQYSDSVQQIQERRRRVQSLPAYRDDREGQIRELQQDKKKLQQEKEKLLQDKEKLQQDKEELMQDKEKLQQDKEELMQDKEKLQQDKEELQQDKEKLQQDKEELQQDKEELMQDKEKLQQDKEELQQDKEKLQQQNKEEQIEKMTASEKVTAQLQQNLQYKNQMIQELLNKDSLRQELQKKLEEKDQEIKKLEQVTREKDYASESQLRELNKKLADKDQELQQTNEKLQDNNQQIQKLQEVQLQKNGVIETKERQLKELSQLLADTEQATGIQGLKNENQRLLEENQRLLEENQHLLEENQHLKEYDKVKLTWKSCDELQSRMHRGSATVCGSIAYFRAAESSQVHLYNSDTEQWSSLPDCPKTRFTLTVINGLVTAVGGKHLPSRKRTDTLLSLVEEHGRTKWLEHFPPMPTRRKDTAVVCSEIALVVAGGEGKKEAKLSTVEVMYISIKQWSTASCLPHPLSDATVTLCGNRVYLVGGRDKQGYATELVFTCSLNALLQSQTMEAKKTTPSLAGSQPVWDTIPNLPVKCSTCVTLKGQLLAVGGYESNGEETNNIYLHNAKANSWEVIGNVSTPRYSCLVTVLPGNKLMVVGGESEAGDSKRVEIATVQ